MNNKTKECSREMYKIKVQDRICVLFKNIKTKVPINTGIKILITQIVKVEAITNEGLML